MDGRPVLSCLVLAVSAAGKSIETIEGLAKDSKDLHPIQQAWVENDATQCGFCAPGMIMNAKALLEFKSNPNRDEIKEFMAGTLCRCGAHPNIIKAMLSLAS
jgi:aerobic-type carbon monoxide dehydrogenase small subunit (CoxS/CutS family)